MAIKARKLQNGAALVVALLVLIIVTLIGLAGMRTGVLELHMSLNDEQRMRFSQTLQGSLEWVSSGNWDATKKLLSSKIKLKGLPGEITQCSSNYSGCPDSTWPGSATPPFSSNETIVVRRLYPSYAPPPRMRGYEYSVGIPAAFYQIEATYNAKNNDSGYARAVQGMMLLDTSGGL